MRRAGPVGRTLPCGFDQCTLQLNLGQAPPCERHTDTLRSYHEDMTSKAISWIGQQKALIPDKPFFVYFAPGATHAPHHVPKEWADKYKGKFDQGWDKLREERSRDS